MNSQSPASSSQSTVEVIDCHCHYAPAPVVQAFARAMQTSSGDDLYHARDEGTPEAFREWTFPRLPDIEAHLRDAAASGVTGEVFTYSNALPPGAEMRIINLINVEVAGLMQRYPGSVVGTAAANPFGGKEAIHDLERAVTELGLKGVSIQTSYGGRYLDSPDLAEFYEAVVALDVPIFVHPALTPVGWESMREYLLPAVIGYPFETTLCLARIIFSGLLDRYPNLKFVFTHSGGALPYLQGRLDTFCDAFKGEFSHLEDRPANYIRRVYVDSNCFSAAALRCAIEVVGPDQVLFGSDYPFMPYHDALASLKVIDQLELSTETRRKILSENARRLLRLD